MFDAWREKSRKEAEAKWLDEIRARDADVGVPSTETMKERLASAAIKRMWDVVDDCLQKGADVKGWVAVSKNWGSKKYFAPFRRLGGLGYCSERSIPLLCMAVMHKDVKAAQNLLAQGADPSDGYSLWHSIHLSPLMIAVRYNSAEMVKLLCDSGASLADDAPLRLAEEKGYNDIIKIIRAEEAKRAQGVAPAPPPPASAGEKIISDLAKLSPAAREMLLVVAREKFSAPAAPAVPADGLAQGVVVLKPIILKKPGA